MEYKGNKKKTSEIVRYEEQTQNKILKTKKKKNKHSNMWRNALVANFEVV